MDWITDNVAIGNFLDAENPDSKVDFILCLKPECCTDRKDIEVVRIPLVDGSGNDQFLYRYAVSAVKKAVAAGKHVLVHCHAGRSRSVCVVARYLMESKGISSDEALAFIKQKRDICLTQGIEEGLHEDQGRTMT